VDMSVEIRFVGRCSSAITDRPGTGKLSLRVVPTYLGLEERG